MTRLLALAALLVATLLTVAGDPARAGGTPRAYVQLPSSGRLLLVDVDSMRVLRSVPVPTGAGPIAASSDGSRVLVASAQRGVVTAVDGIHGRVTHTFSGLGRPVDIVLVPRMDVGLVRPRYALVADGRGFVDTLDLVRGTVARRTPVLHPTALALSGGMLWVASAGRTRVTLLDVSDPAVPRVVGRPQIGVTPIALAVDSQVAAGVDAVSAHGRFVQLDGVSLARTRTRQIATGVTQLIAAYQGEVLAVTRAGRVLDVRARDGHVSGVTRVPSGSRVTLVGGYLAATSGRALTLRSLGAAPPPKTTPLPGVAGNSAFALLP